MSGIHISDVRTFKKCRRKWNFSSPLRMNLESVVPYAPFFTGRAIHHCLEMYYEHGTPLDKSLAEYLKEEYRSMEEAGKLWPQEEEAFANEVFLQANMLKHYQMWISRDKSRWSDDNLKVVAMETEFNVPLVDPTTGEESDKIFLEGRFDGIVQRKDDDSLWLWEVKTTRSIKELSSSLRLDEQAGAYLLAAQKLYGKPFAGVLYTMLRKKVPPEPKVLKSGMVSVAKNSDTTSFWYVEFLKEHHENWSEDFLIKHYGDALRHYSQNNTSYFLRVPVYRTQEELMILERNLWDVATEMMNPDIPLYPAPDWMGCNFCFFRAPCEMMNSGNDPSLILETEFRSRDPWQSFKTTEERNVPA